MVIRSPDERSDIRGRGLAWSPPDVAPLIRARVAERAAMSIAEVYDFPARRQPLVPPSPPLAPDNQTAFGRMRVMRDNIIATWGKRAYEEDVIQSRFLGRASF